MYDSTDFGKYSSYSDIKKKRFAHFMYLNIIKLESKSEIFSFENKNEKRVKL